MKIQLGNAYAYLAMANRILDSSTRDGTIDCAGCGAALNYSVDEDGTVHLRCTDKCYSGGDWMYKRT